MTEPAAGERFVPGRKITTSGFRPGTVVEVRYRMRTWDVGYVWTDDRDLRLIGKNGEFVSVACTAGLEGARRDGTVPFAGAGGELDEQSVKVVDRKDLVLYVGWRTGAEFGALMKGGRVDVRKCLTRYGRKMYEVRWQAAVEE